MNPRLLHPSSWLLLATGANSRNLASMFLAISVQTLKSEYTVAIDRIREMRAAEDEAQEETGRSARSVETLAVQVSSATRELDGLQEKASL